MSYGVQGGMNTHKLGLPASVVQLGVTPGQELAGAGSLLLRGSKASSHDRRAESGSGEHGGSVVMCVWLSSECD